MNLILQQLPNAWLWLIYRKLVVQVLRALVVFPRFCRIILQDNRRRLHPTDPVVRR
jgi:hypothetical protein